MVQLAGVYDVLILIESLRFELLEVFIDVPDSFWWFGMGIQMGSHNAELLTLS